jgi:tetratricopeptide (TPR) repeat protein
MEAGNVRILSALRHLAMARIEQGNLQEAARLYERVQAGTAVATGAREANLGQAHLLGAHLALAQEDPERALAEAEASVDFFRRRFPEEHSRLADAEVVAAVALCRLGLRDEGRPRAQAAYENLLRALGPDSRWTRNAWRALQEDCA